MNNFEKFDQESEVPVTSENVEQKLVSENNKEKELDSEALFKESVRNFKIAPEAEVSTGREIILAF